MTAYWPTHLVLRYATLQPRQKLEIANARLGISQRTMVACHSAASKIPACMSMAVIRSEDVPQCRVYLQHPSYEQWMALERGGFMEIWDNFGFVMDALH